MEIIANFFKEDIFVVALILFNFLLLVLYVCNGIKLSRINKNYKQFMKKIGKGEDIEENLRKYLNKVEEVSNNNEEIYNYCKKLENDISKTIKKVGIVRYNAFKDTGSDLSFTLALLNEYNDGVVLNGIYSRETSNIFAKPIEKGSSKYTLSEEEKQAIDKAIQSEETYKIN